MSPPPRPAHRSFADPSGNIFGVKLCTDATIRPNFFVFFFFYSFWIFSFCYSLLFLLSFSISSYSSLLFSNFLLFFSSYPSLLISSFSSYSRPSRRSFSGPYGVNNDI
jgi:hypothetical protein